jgi:hypothetical protein
VKSRCCYRDARRQARTDHAPVSMMDAGLLASTPTIPATGGPHDLRPSRCIGLTAFGLPSLWDRPSLKYRRGGCGKNHSRPRQRSRNFPTTEPGARTSTRRGTAPPRAAPRPAKAADKPRAAAARSVRPPATHRQNAPRPQVARVPAPGKRRESDQLDPNPDRPLAATLARAREWLDVILFNAILEPTLMRFLSPKSQRAKTPA